MINTTSQHIISTVNRPYVYNNNTSHGLSGQVRYNFTMNYFEVFDGTSWQPYVVNLNLSLDNDTLDLLNWVKKQREEQIKIQELCRNYPTIADLKEKLDTMIALVKEPINDNV